MTVEDKTDPKQGETENSSPDARYVEAVAHYADTNTRKHQPKRRKPMSSYKKWQIGLAITGAVLAGGGLVVLCRQADIMATQNRLMELQIGEARETFRNEQGAWVGPHRYTRPSADSIRAHAPNLVFTAWHLNSGNTPALHVVTNIRTRFMPVGEDFEPLPYGSGGRSSETVIQPKVETASYVRKSFTMDEVGDIIAGRVVFYVYGRATYDDVFKRSHETTFCVFLLPDLSAVAHCDRYNNAN